MKRIPLALQQHNPRLTLANQAVTLCHMPHGFYTHILCLLPLSLAVAQAGAEEIRQLSVEHAANRYSVSFDVMLNAPAEKTLPLMVDPANWPRLTDIVSTSEVVENLGVDKKKVRITFEGCVLFICKTLKKTEIMQLLPGGEITTLALPEESDFLYAREHWRITGTGRRTRVEYQAELVPDFFVPPLIGPYILKSKLQSFLTQTAHNLEQLSR